MHIKSLLISALVSLTLASCSNGAGKSNGNDSPSSDTELPGDTSMPFLFVDDTPPEPLLEDITGINTGFDNLSRFRIAKLNAAFLFNDKLDETITLNLFSDVKITIREGEFG